LDGAVGGVFGIDAREDHVAEGGGVDARGEDFGGIHGVGGAGKKEKTGHDYMRWISHRPGEYTPIFLIVDTNDRKIRRPNCMIYMANLA
jgi:hypothetical protein